MANAKPTYTKHEQIPPRHAAAHADALNHSMALVRAAIDPLPDDGLRHLVLCTVHAELALRIDLDPYIAAGGVVAAHGKIKELRSRK